MFLVLVFTAGYASKIEPARANSNAPGKYSRATIASLVERQTALWTVLEGHMAFRSARIVGPFQHREMFGREPQTYFCVAVEVEQLLADVIQEIRTFAIRAGKTSDGRNIYTVVEVRISGQVPTACTGKKYEPFPELVRARLERRKNREKRS